MKRVSVNELLTYHGSGTRFIEDDGFSVPSGIRVVIGGELVDGKPVLKYSELNLGASVTISYGTMSVGDITPCYVMEPEDIVKLGPYMSALSFRYRDNPDGGLTVSLDLPKWNFKGMLDHHTTQLGGPDTNDVP